MAEFLIEGKYYRCVICSRVYRRGLSRRSTWPACGHSVKSQVEISGLDYKEAKKKTQPPRKQICEEAKRRGGIFLCKECGEKLYEKRRNNEHERRETWKGI